MLLMVERYARAGSRICKLLPEQLTDAGQHFEPCLLRYFDLAGLPVSVGKIWKDSSAARPCDLSLK